MRGLLASVNGVGSSTDSVVVDCDTVDVGIIEFDWLVGEVAAVETFGLQLLSAKVIKMI